MYKLFCIFIIILFIILPNLNNNKTNINESFQNDTPFYYINLDRSQDRNKHMIDMFRKHKINNYKRIRAVDGKNDKELYSILKEIPRNSKESNFQLSCLCSHIKSIKQAFDDGLEEVFICEDNLVIDHYIKNKKSYNDIINKAPNNWEIIQLLVHNNIDQIYNNNNNNYVKWNNKKRSSACKIYLINRNGMKKILQFYKNDKIILPNNNNIIHYYTADYLLYDLCNTYIITYPYFSFYTDGISNTWNKNMGPYRNKQIKNIEKYQIL